MFIVICKDCSEYPVEANKLNDLESHVASVKYDLSKITLDDLIRSAFQHIEKKWPEESIVLAIKLEESLDNASTISALCRILPFHKIILDQRSWSIS